MAFLIFNICRSLATTPGKIGKFLFFQSLGDPPSPHPWVPLPQPPPPPVMYEWSLACLRLWHSDTIHHLGHIQLLSSRDLILVVI